MIVKISWLTAFNHGIFYKSFSCFLFIFWSLSANSQVDSILALPGEDRRLKGFIDWATDNIFWHSHLHRERKVEQLNEASEKFLATGDQRLIQECWFFTKLFNVGGAMYQPTQWEASAAKMLEAAGMAHEKNWLYTEAECRMAASAMYFNKAKYMSGFEQAFRAHDLIQRAGFHNYPEANRFIAEIADRYYLFNDVKTAIYYFRQAFNVSENWIDFDRSFSALNTLALCYRSQEMYESAAYFFEQANAEAEKKNEKFWSAMILGNLGRMRATMGQYDEALSLFLHDFETSKANNQFNSAGNVAQEIAEIYMHKGMLTDAEKYLAYSRKYFDTTDGKSNADLFRKLSMLTRLHNDYQHAYYYLDSFVSLSNKINKKRNLTIITSTKQKVQIEKYILQLKLLESEKKVQLLISNGIVAGVLLGGIITLLLIGWMRMRKNSAIKTAALESKLVTEELNHSLMELEAFKKLLTEKSELIDSFKTGIEETQSGQLTQKRTDVLSQLAEASILTADDWTEFKTLFDKVYPGYFTRLQDKIPDMSVSDMQLLTLTRLQVSQKEMAAMLGIGYDALRKARQRLRSKIKLGKDESLEELVNSI